MTQNQLQYWANVETERANRAREAENTRHNTAAENEMYRHNRRDEENVKQGNTFRYLGDIAKTREQTRHNKVDEAREGTDSKVRNATSITNTVMDFISGWKNQNRETARTLFDAVKFAGGIK